MNTDEINNIYEELDSLINSLIPNESKANNLRKFFEKVLKLYLGYTLENKINLFKMIDEYILKSRRQNLQYISHKLRDDLNTWSHATNDKLEDDVLNDYYVRLQNIIKEVTGVTYNESFNETNLFSIDKLSLNEEQQKAALSKSKFTLVNAGPGTGRHILL